MLTAYVYRNREKNSYRSKDRQEISVNSGYIGDLISIKRLSFFSVESTPTNIKKPNNIIFYRNRHKRDEGLAELCPPSTAKLPVS